MSATNLDIRSNGSSVLVTLVQTICISNRMEHDRQKYGLDPTFSQLFVARSKRLCRYVSETVGAHDQSTFQTFEELIYKIDTTLPRLEKNNRHFYPSQRVDFQRFKQEFHAAQTSKDKGKKETISAMIVWTG